ncbi:MAG: STAS domain-containing protein [Blastocatellia bacterium]
MLRMTTIITDAQKVIFLLEGKIINPWVEEINKECQKHFSIYEKLILDVSQVSFVDEEGVKLLKNLIKDKVELVGCSLFLSKLLS